MKVGIMSMQRIENYGSFLQAYCLRQILEEMGQNIIFIDYIIEPCIVKEPERVIIHHSIPYRILRKIYYWFKDLCDFISGKKFKEKKLESMRLRIQYKNYLRELGITEERTENTPVDLLIIGSDEVFNCLQTNSYVGYSKQLFGEGVNAKRVISYAASAGFTTIDGLKSYGILDQVAYMLKTNFDGISVRDDNTYRLVQSLTGMSPEKHLDPVLIGNLSECIIENNDLNKYVVVYSYEERMSNHNEEAEAIQKFAYENGLKTVSIGNFQKWTDLKIEASPFELLGYIKNAEYVVTDTFHGTIFSIVLHKQFGTIVRESNRQKLTALLKTFSLENRCINNLNDISDILKTEVNYENIEIIREKEKEKTKKYLSSFFNK